MDASTTGPPPEKKGGHTLCECGPNGNGSYRILNVRFLHVKWERHAVRLWIEFQKTADYRHLQAFLAHRAGMRLREAA